MLGDTEIAVGAGAESMSRAPYIAPAQRWGARMGDVAMLDMMTGALSDPFGRMHMGVTAENVAAKFGISRADQDALAAESHRRSEEHTSELQSLMRTSYAVFCLKNKKCTKHHYTNITVLCSLSSLYSKF